MRFWAGRFLGAYTASADVADGDGSLTMNYQAKGTKMGSALATDSFRESPWSAEVEQRMSSAQENDIAFFVRRIAPRLSDDDIFFLASVLHEARKVSPRVSKEQISGMILKRGLSEDRARELSSAIFK